MGKIFYIMGPSSTGKDTVYNKLLERSEDKLQKIVMYTTRPIRKEEIQGSSYHFVSEKKLEEIQKTEDFIELRAYETYHGIWKYFTVNDGQILLEKSNYLLIGTIESYLKTQEYFGEGKVVPIFITTDDGIRLQRALDRERLQGQPKYEEMCRRFLADAQDFSVEKLQKARIDTTFLNIELDSCIQEIEQYISQELN